MATECTSLLAGCVVEIPRNKDEYEVLGESQKTKSLSLEELMPYQDDPWWQNLRRTFFLSFWITLMLVFVTACILSILRHDSCDSLQNPIPDSVSTIVANPLTTITTLISPGTAKIPSQV